MAEANSNSTKRSVVIIGAGAAGLGAAQALVEMPHFKVRVIEASAEVGGLAKTISLWGYPVDLGPHRFFAQDGRVRSLWSRFIGRDHVVINRLTRIFHNGRFLKYPIEPIDLLRNLGAYRFARYAISFLRQMGRQSQEASSMKAWLTTRYGHRLYADFFYEYTKKLWGMDPEELAPEFAAQRIQSLSLYDLFMACLGLRSAKARTLLTEFHYPLEGNGILYRRIAEHVIGRGGTISLGIKVKRVTVESGKVTGLELSDGSVLNADYVISTMPMTALLQALGERDEKLLRTAARLKFRDTRLAYFLLEGPNPFPDQWIYVQSTAVKTGRITNFRNWLPHLYEARNETVLCMEYWGWSHDEIQTMSDANFIRVAQMELERLFVNLRGSIRGASALTLKRSYPVYYRGFREDVAAIQEYLGGIDGLFIAGRYGAYRYGNQDHSLLMGLETAEQVCAGGGRIGRTEDPYPATYYEEHVNT